MADQSQQQTLLDQSLDLALLPLRTATSKKAQRAYIGTAFLFAACSLLLGLSTVAYLLFYYNYIPQIGIARDIYLQFGTGHPYGVVDLSSKLVSQQAYDVSVALHLPRSPPNLATGNFMLDVSFVAPPQRGSSASQMVQSAYELSNGSETVLARSRRPAILTYASPLVETAHVLVGLPWMLTGWRKESEKLEVNMFEGVQFAKGWKNIPSLARISLEADEKMQVYEVTLHIHARFSGLRWIMYNYRVLSFMFFTSAFFTVSLASALTVYLMSGSVADHNDADTTKPIATVKQENSDAESEPANPLSTSDLSDTARTFPTIGRQRPLSFSRQSASDTQIKREDDTENFTSIEALGTEADDEEDFEEGSSAWRDSGIGTGRDDRVRRPTQRRRQSSPPR